MMNRLVVLKNLLLSSELIQVMGREEIDWLANQISRKLAGRRPSKREFWQMVRSIGLSHQNWHSSLGLDYYGCSGVIEVDN